MKPAELRRDLQFFLTKGNNYGICKKVIRKKRTEVITLLAGLHACAGKKAFFKGEL